MSDTSQDCDDVRRTRFRFLDNNEALRRKYETAVVLQNSFLNPQSQPKRAEPGHQKTGQCQKDLLPLVRPENVAEQNQKEGQNDSGCGPAVGGKPGIQDPKTAVLRAVNYPGPSKVVLPNLLKCFLGMLYTAVKREYQSRGSRLPDDVLQSDLNFIVTLFGSFSQPRRFAGDPGCLIH